MDKEFVEQAYTANDAHGYQYHKGDKFMPEVKDDIAPWMFYESTAEKKLSDNSPVDDVTFAKAIHQDLKSGATIDNIEVKGTKLNVSMMEADGTSSQVTISKSGDTLRYADGKLSSFSSERPAVAFASGDVVHKAIVNGQQVDMTASEANEFFNAPQPQLDHSNLMASVRG